MAAPRYNVFVGSETGLLKGVSTTKSRFDNLIPLKNVSRNLEITTLCWTDDQEKELVYGLRNQTVKVFNTRRQTVTHTINVNGGEGPLKGLALCNEKIITCTESGFLKLWDPKQESEVVLNVGKDIFKMRQKKTEPLVVATGGKENDLKIWDLQNTERPLFAAKNVRNDFLDLRVPVWVYDMQFVPDSEKIVTVSGHHLIRLYDLKMRQRRPVISMEFDEYPITSVSIAHRENQIVIGNARGRMALIDLRKKAMVHTFKGFAGSIRSVQCHPTLPLVASCGLDRFLRIHDLNTKRMLLKMYLKSRLNCLLLRNEFKLFEEKTDDNDDDEDNNKGKETEKGDQDVEEIWNAIDVVSDEETEEKQNNEKIKRKKPNSRDKNIKKKKT